jgi:hypothetical protein
MWITARSSREEFVISPDVTGAHGAASLAHSLESLESKAASHTLQVAGDLRNVEPRC